MVKKKLCYVLPEYDSRSHAHFAYLPDFIRAISGEFDVFLIIEKGERPADDWGCRRIQVACFSFWPFKWCELHCRLLYARFWGCRDFYVHYSFAAAFLASAIVRFCGGRVFYWNCGLPWRYRRGFLREHFERFTYRLITHLVTGTEGMKKQYAEHYRLPPEKIKVMPNWVNLKNFQFSSSDVQGDQLRKKLNIGPDQKVILFVHRLSKRKGAHYLPEIAKQLNIQIPNSKFQILIIGDGPERASVEAEINKRGLSDRARFLGWVPNDELPSYYLAADVFIVPSEEEGFPRVLLEAMAFGVPFVTFDVGGVSEIIPPALAEFAVAEGDIDVLVARIEKILAGSKIVEIKAAEADWIKQFDLSKAVERFKALFL